MSGERVALAQRLFAQRKEQEALWERVYQFVVPEAAWFFAGSRLTPSQIGDKVFDATAIDAAERLTNLFSSGLIPSWQKWGRLVPGPQAATPEDREAVRPALQRVEDYLFAALSQTTFYEEMQPVILDRIVGGTGCLMVRTDGELRFRAIPLAQIALAEDHEGQVAVVARRYKMSLHQMQKAFGAKVPRQFAEQHMSREHEVMHEVYALDEKNPTGWVFGQYLGDGHVLERRQLRHRTFLVTRWGRVPGSVYGRGPALRALSDIRAVNKIKEFALKNAAWESANAYMVADDGVLNPYTMTVEPGAFVAVASNDRASPSVMPWPRTGNFDVSMFALERLQASVEAAFMANQFGPLDRTPMSATEVQARAQVLARDMGSTIARMQSEMLKPLIRIVFGFLQDNGMAPADVEVDGRSLEVQFVSQLAQAQQALDEQNLMDFAAIVTSFGEIDPKAGMVLDVHKAMLRLAEIKHINPADLRTLDEIESMLEEAQTAMEVEDEMRGQGDGMV